MSAIPTEIEKIATAVAVGSLFCLGLFLGLHVANQSFFTRFEGFATTASFGVIAATPTLAFLYIVGSLISLLSDFVFQCFNPKDYDKEWEMLAQVARNNNETVSITFYELHRKKKILEGSVLPLIAFGLGILLECRNYPDLKHSLILSGVSILILAALLPLFTGKIQHNMEVFLRLVAQQTPTVK
jgi:hypothetical protein